MARDYISGIPYRNHHSNERLTETEKRRLVHSRHDGRTGSIEDVFIRSLVAAGRCSEHRRWQWHGEQRLVRDQYCSGKNGAFRSQPKRALSTSTRRTQTAVAAARDQEPPEAMISNDEYKDMVNTYGLPSDMWDEPAAAPAPAPKRKKQQEYPLAPRLVVPPDKEDKPPYTEREVLEPEDEEHARDIQKFRLMLQREPGTFRQGNMWRLYESLRRPRVRYLTNRDIRNAFNHLTWNEFVSTSKASLRYFALLDECLREDVPLTIVEWSAGINFAGRQMRYGTSEDVKNAIELWMKMEESGVEANNVTFNILFYTAVKAGRYALADTIVRELQARGMELDRYFHASKIYYAGVRGNGDGVRRAFNDLVDANEIVDIAIMNCVILSLIRSGEAQSAEHVFAKLKNLHETKFGTKGPDQWQEQRKLGKLLNQTGKALRKQRKQHISSFFGTAFSGDDRKEQIQKAAPIAPNARTYRLLLRYHARVSGDMGRLQELLAESKACGFQTHGSVYFNIFFGFHAHGGYAYTAWPPSLLDKFWEEFLSASSFPNLDGSFSTGSDHMSDQDVLQIHSAEAESESGSDGTSVENFRGPEGLDEMEEDDLGLEDDAYESEEDRAPYFTQSMAIVVLRAYHKCCGKKRMLVVWDEIKVRWKECGPQEIETINGLIEDWTRWDL